MDITTTDDIKTAAAAWPSGKPLIVETKHDVMAYADVAVVDGVVYLRLRARAPKPSIDEQLEEMNRDPTTGAAFEDIPVAKSAPEMSPAPEPAGDTPSDMPQPE